MKKTAIGLTIFIVAAYLVTSGAWAAVADRIIAVVNGEAITQYDLNAAMTPILKRIEDNYKGPDKDKIISEARTAILNRMIDDRLIEQEARKFGSIIKDDEVMSMIKNLLAEKNMSLDDLKKTLTRDGTTFESYREKLKEQMLKMRLMKFEVNFKISVADEEIGAYYTRHRSDYEGKEAVRIKQIMILYPKDGDRKEKEKLRSIAETIHKRLLAGEPFDMLAAKYSQGPAAQTGGDLGFLEKGAMVAEVDRIAFSLKLNIISPVIESPMGFHIIQVIDRRGEGIKTIESVRNEIKAKIEEEKMEKKFDEWIDRLRKKSLIEIRP